MDPYMKLGWLMSAVGLLIGGIGGAIIYDGIIHSMFIWTIIIGILVLAVAAMTCVIGDDLRDTPKEKIPDRIGLELAITGGIIAAIGGVIIGSAVAYPRTSILLLGIMMAVAGAIISYIGSFIADLR